MGSLLPPSPSHDPNPWDSKPHRGGHFLPGGDLPPYLWASDYRIRRPLLAPAPPHLPSLPGSGQTPSLAASRPLPRLFRRRAPRGALPPATLCAQKTPRSKGWEVAAWVGGPRRRRRQRMGVKVVPSRRRSFGRIRRYLTRLQVLCRDWAASKMAGMERTPRTSLGATAGAEGTGHF